MSDIDKDNAMMLIQEHVRRLRRLDACAVSDALDKLGLAGTVTGLRQFSTDRRIAGRVVTVKLVSATKAPQPAPANTAPRHLGASAIEASVPGDVIVVEQRSGIDAGGWGGILSLGATVAEVAGVIVDGPVRDIDEARAYGFPVFSRGLTAFTARGRVVEAGTNVPVYIGDVCVAGGDYVVADKSAAVFISREHIESVLDTAEGIARNEAVMAKQLLGGMAISAVMGRNYEEMLKREEQT